MSGTIFTCIVVRFDNLKRAKLGQEDDWSSNSSSDSENDNKKKSDSSEDSSSSSESELSLSESEESSDDPDDDFNPFGNGSDSDEGMYREAKIRNSVQSTFIHMGAISWEINSFFAMYL